MPLKSWNDLLDDAGGAGNDFEPLPEGDYDLVITKSEALQTKNGKTMYKVQCSVEQGPHKGRTVWNNFVISPESPTALSIFFRQMNVLGLDRAYWQSDPSDHQVAEKLKGARFRGQLITRSFNGQESNEIKQFFTPRALAAGPGSGPSAPAPAAAPPAAPAPAPAPAFAAPAPAAAPPQPAPPAPAAAPPAPIQQEAAAPPPAPAAPPVEPAAVAAPPAPPAPPAASGGDTPPPPPPF
jgi:hypothetical protein